MKDFRNDLKLLSTMDILEILDYISTRYIEIGIGSGRVVYALNDDWVIKLALSKCGEDQNLAEIDLYNDCITKLYSPYKEVKNILGEIDLKFSTNLFIVMKRYKQDNNCHLYSRIFKECEIELTNKKTSFDHSYSDTDKQLYLDYLPLVEKLSNIEDVKQYHIISDLYPQNIGIDKNNTPVIVDYGFTRSIMHKMYTIFDYKKNYLTMKL